MGKRTGKTDTARRAAVLWLAGVGLLLAGCGRRSAPKAPEDSTYKETNYPTRPAMGLPKRDPLLPPEPSPEEDDAGGNDTPVPGAYTAPPRGMNQ